MEPTYYVKLARTEGDATFEPCGKIRGIYPSTTRYIIQTPTLSSPNDFGLLKATQVCNMYQLDNVQ